MLLTGRAGRKRQLGVARYASGRKRQERGSRLRPTDKGELLTVEQRRAAAPLLWRRALEGVVAFARDPQLGSEIGRLSMLGILTDGEAATADHIGEVLGRDALLSGSPRPTVASPSFDRGYGGRHDPYGGRDERVRLRFERNARRARRAALRIWDAIDRTFSGRAGDRAKAVILDLCVHDTHVPARFHRDLATLLRIIGEAEGIMRGGDDE
jgi:hypothetical protein